MADRYWVGGTGNWSDDTNHWATTSGGAPGAGNKPTASDNAIFDAASNTTAYTVTIDAAAVCLDLNFSAAPSVSGTITWAGSSTMAISGAMTLLSGMTRSYTGTITFNATSGTKNITMNSVALGGSVTFNGAGGTWQNQDNFNIGSGTITVTNGTWDSNGKTVTAQNIVSTSGTRTLTLGASAITLSSNGGTGINFNTSGTFTFNCGTSAITFNGANGCSFNGAGQTFYDLTYTPTGDATINFNGANSFHNLTFTGGAAVSQFVNFGADQTVSNAFTATGNSAALNRFCLKSNTVGTARTITAASVTLTNVDCIDITGAGAASPFTGTSLGDGGGNSGITFTSPVTRYWVATSGGNWGATSSWSSSSGGGSGASVPLLQDTAVFDSNSITSGSRTITINPLRVCGHDFTNILNTPNITYSLQTQIYGSMNLTATNTLTMNSSGVVFAGRSSYTLTSNGKNFRPLTLTAPGGTLTLQDTYTSTLAGIIVNNGTFNAGNQNITILTFDSNNSNTRTITMGSGTWTLTSTGTVWNVATTTGLTLNSNTSTIKLTNNSASSVTFAGGGTYNNIWFSRSSGTGAIVITGTNTFTEYKDDGTAAHTVTFPNVTTTVTRFICRGSSGNLITLQRTGGAGTWTLSCSAGPIICDWLSISNSTVTGGAVFFAGANTTNGGGNTNWKFYGPAASVGGAAAYIGSNVGNY